MDINIDFREVFQNITYMAIAYVLAMPIAWDREHRVRSAGLRTFPLVAVASCGFMLIGISVLDSTDAEARVLYGIRDRLYRWWCHHQRQKQGVGNRNSGEHLEHGSHRHRCGLESLRDCFGFVLDQLPDPLDNATVQATK